MHTTHPFVAARYFRFYGHAVDAYHGTTIPLGPDLHACMRREPYGVVGSIVAWNYPMQLLSRAVDGAPVVEAGMPPGVFTVVTWTDRRTGADLGILRPEEAHLRPGWDVPLQGRLVDWRP